MCCPPFIPPKKSPATNFCLRLSQPRATVQLEGVGQLEKKKKNPMTASGIEPTFQLVA
jgi:hypothetical protein